jgi:hypothetical protein
MQTIYFTLNKELSLMIIPDTRSHLDGHRVSTYTYSIYRNQLHNDRSAFNFKQSNLYLEKKHDPDYLGFVIIEKPGDQFCYSADGQEQLANDEVKEIIEVISDFQDRPQMWKAPKVTA